MALTPTEREEHFFKAMVDAAGGSTPEELEPTERKEHWYKEIIDAIKAGGGGSGGDGNIFIVNATFTEGRREWSVALDKTFAEIYAASNAGKIVLCIPYESASGATGYPCVATVESTEAFATTDVNAGRAVYSFDFGVDSNDDTYVTETTWSKSGGGALVVHDVDGTLDKKWQEIYDAASNGVPSILHEVVEEGLVTFNFYLMISVMFVESNKFYAVAFGVKGTADYKEYSADSASGYPTQS